MKVTEQINAMEASAVDPFTYLVATRVMACVLMLPLLTVCADFCPHRGMDHNKIYRAEPDPAFSRPMASKARASVTSSRPTR